MLGKTNVKKVEQNIEKIRGFCIQCFVRLIIFYENKNKAKYRKK